MNANTSVVEANASLYSDLYKDLNNFRPDLARFRALTLDEQQEEIDHISATLEEQIAEDYEPDYEDDSRYDEPYSSGPDYWQNEDGEWRLG